MFYVTIDGVKKKPKVVCLCGSTRFKGEFERAEKELTLSGDIVLTVGLFGHLEGLDMSGPTKAMLDELHLCKIAMADEILVIDVGGYVGSSTAKEIYYAWSMGKKVRYLFPVSDQDDEHFKLYGTPRRKDGCRE